MTRPRDKHLAVGGRPSKHGSRALVRHLTQNRLDQRTTTARLLRMVAEDLADDAGGWASLTNREKVLVDRCAAQIVILQSVENWVLRQPSLLESDGALLAVLRRGYLGHLNTLRLNLVALGLRPGRADKVPTLEEYLAARDNGTAGSDGPVPGSTIAGWNDLGAVSPGADAPAAPAGGAAA